LLSASILNDNRDILEKCHSFYSGIDILVEEKLETTVGFTVFVVFKILWRNVFSISFTKFWK